MTPDPSIERSPESQLPLASARIAQLLVPVDDLAKGVAFYRDVLGLPFLFEAPPQMAFFHCGGVRLLVGVPPAGQVAQRGSAIYFQVPEIVAAFSALKEDTSMEGVAGAALWLLSDLGRSTTGEVVHVDAGFHMIGLPDEVEAGA